MAPTNSPLSIAGSQVHFEEENVFDWLFSDPFSTVNEFTPSHQKIPVIEGSRPIFVDQASDRTLTHAHLKRDALSLAAGLRSLNLNPQDTIHLPPTPTCARPEIAPVVLIQMPNCLAFAPVFLGVLASGLTATLVSPALTASEIGWILQNSRPSCVFAATACMAAMTAAVKAQDDQEFFSKVPVYGVDVDNDTYPLPPMRSLAPDWRQLLVPVSNSEPRFTKFSPKSRAAVILWSSGTSGRSKGVLISHHALNFAAAALWHDADWCKGQRQRFTGYIPFYHVFGLLNIFLLGICCGATVYTMPSFKLDVILDTIARRGITYLHMAPPVAIMLAKSPAVEPYARRDANGRNAFSTVVSAVTGGAPLGHEVVLQLHARLGFRLRLGYGLTEAGSVTIQRGIDEEEMRLHKYDTGQPHWGVELMIAAPESTGQVGGETKPAPVESQGEVLIRTPGMMTAYLPFAFHSLSSADMSVTEAALTPDGWFRTGDIGTLDAEGRLTITDRIKELIKVQAYQVAPAELEAILCGSPSVADAGVVATYDRDAATEWPRAYVVPADSNVLQDEQAARRLAMEVKAVVEKKTAKYKWLRGGIVFVGSVPKSPSGKILRRVLREGGVKGREVAVYDSRTARASKI